MRNWIPFQVHNLNTFDSGVSLEDIRNDLKTNKIQYSLDDGTLITKDMYEFFVNWSNTPLRTKLICHEKALEDCLTLCSDHKFTFPKVDFDASVSYGWWCDGDDTQYVLDFKRNIIYIVWSDIHGSLWLAK